MIGQWGQSHGRSRLHYTDGVHMACPSLLAPVTLDPGVSGHQCPTHGPVEATVVPLIDYAPPPDPRFCTGCGCGVRDGARTWRRLCDDCAEVTDKMWARVLADPSPAPWVHMPDPFPAMRLLASLGGAR